MFEQLKAPCAVFLLYLLLGYYALTVGAYAGSQRSILEALPQL